MKVLVIDGYKYCELPKGVEDLDSYREKLSLDGECRFYSCKKNANN